jgi:hypothetical protein
LFSCGAVVSSMILFFEFVHNMFQVVFMCLYCNHVSNPSLCMQFSSCHGLAYFCPTLIIVGNAWCAVYINTLFEIFFEAEIRHVCLWKMNCCGITNLQRKNNWMMH